MDYNHLLNDLVIKQEFTPMLKISYMELTASLVALVTLALVALLATEL